MNPTTFAVACSVLCQAGEIKPHKQWSRQMSKTWVLSSWKKGCRVLLTDLIRYIGFSIQNNKSIFWQNVVWFSLSAGSMRKLNWHLSSLKWNQISSEKRDSHRKYLLIFIPQVRGEEQLEQLGCNHSGRWIGGPHVMTWLHFSLWSHWHNVTSTLLTSWDQSRVDGAAEGLPLSYYHHKASQ